MQACYELACRRIASPSCRASAARRRRRPISSAAHGFNSVHGRMPSVLTGANLANRDLIYLGVSGDGDSASIGFGQFAHSIRRGVNMVYIVANNGVYGLTKGQFSATADKGAKLKKGAVNSDRPSISSPWRCSSARPSSPAPSPATRPAGAADQGRDRASSGPAFIDVHLALRRLQQSRRLDQELRLCARPQRGAECARLRHERAPITTDIRAGRDAGGAPARRLDDPPAQDRRDYDVHRPRRGDELSVSRAAPRARSSPA
jgi:hypothetical protein